MKLFLQNRNFVLLWLSQIFCQFAERLLIFILVLMIYEKTNSNMGTAMVGLTFGLPAILFGAFAGLLVDIWDKKRTLFFVNFIRSLIILGLFFVYSSTGNISFLFIFSFFIAILLQLFVPAETSSIPIIVKNEQLEVANSIFIITFHGIGIVGIYFGSLLAPVFINRNDYFLLVALCFFISSIFIFFMTHLKGHIQLAKTKNIFIEFYEGIKYTFLEYRIRNLMLQTLIITTVFSCITILGIGFVDQVLKMPKEKFGYLALPAGLGIALGIGVMNLFFQKTPGFRKIIFGFIGGGISLMLFSVAGLIFTSQKFLVSMFFLAVGGFFLGWIIIPIQTMLQKITSPAFRGRIFGFQNMVLNFSLTLPVLILGRLADLYGIEKIFFGVSFIVFMQGIFMIFQLKHLELEVKIW